MRPPIVQGPTSLLLQQRCLSVSLIYYIKQIRVPFLPSRYRWLYVTSQGHIVRWKWWSLVIVYDDYTSSYYYTRALFFSDFHQTSQVRTLGGPYYTYPFSLTLTYFSRSQTHFSAKITKFKIVITLLFLGGFWSNFTGMDPRSTPSVT